MKNIFITYNNYKIWKLKKKKLKNEELINIIVKREKKKDYWKILTWNVNES